MDILNAKLAKVDIEQTPEEIIEETVQFIGDHEIDPEQAVPKFISGKLVNTREEKLNREKVFATLRKFQNDPSFGIVPLPLDFIAHEFPNMWDDSCGMTLQQYLEYEDLNLRLMECKTTQEKRKVMKDKLRAKLLQQHQRKLLNIQSLKKRNKVAKRLLREEMAKMKTEKIA